MFLNLLNLFSGFSLILIAMAILLHYVRTQKINFFFFLLMLMSGISRFHFGLTTLHILDENQPLALRFFITMFLIPPIVFLCLNSFMSIKTPLKKIIAHLSFFFTILFARIYFGQINMQAIGIIFLVYSGFYYFLLIRSTLSYFKQHQSVFSKQQLLKVKQLVVWIFALSFNNFIIIIYYVLFASPNKAEAIQSIFHSTIISWALFLIYLFFNPNIIFNEVFQKKDRNRDFSKEFNIWSTKALRKIEPQDSALEAIVRKNTAKMLEDFKQLKPEGIIETTSTKLLSEIANQLNYPKSHLKFILKYHCRFSHSDYLNLMRLIHALTLINNGYLENYTIETLGEHCHFNSRTSFYRHFKRHLGVSPSQYKTLIE
ncbi:MAG: AraC family transcriptional regulator [Crocinitomicaceae bacterium]|nr:AraC family transcriptional regulator [Crocinitomicaceae bacterium]MDP4724243.1 AraC family transcriptional regulator [Crocinitomicaceae bacterium]